MKETNSIKLILLDTKKNQNRKTKTDGRQLSWIVSVEISRGKATIRIASKD